MRNDLRSALPAVWSRDLAVADEELPPWMIELAEGLRLWRPGELPTGVIVGSAIVENVTQRPRGGMYEWHLADIERLARPRRPRRQPQPVWFRPF